jgi:hypothetical protein
MAISTSTQDLINYYKNKKENDKRQKEQIQLNRVGYVIKQEDESKDIKVWGVLELIEKFDKPIECLDLKIVGINSDIQEKQELLLQYGISANLIGCGVTVLTEGAILAGFSSTTVYKDTVKYIGWDFAGANPFQQIGPSPLTVSNAGIGTNDFVTAGIIGTFHEPVSTCTGFLCTTEICSGYASSVTTLKTEIAALQEQRNEYIATVNILKSKRARFTLQDWGYRKGRSKLQDEIDESDTIINFLETSEEDCL